MPQILDTVLKAHGLNDFEQHISYHNAAREELPLLSKDYQYDACDNLIAEVLTQTQRRSNHNSAQEPVIGRFEAHNSNGKSHTLSQHYRYDPTERIRQHYQHTPQAPGQHSETFNYDAAANLMQNGVLRGHVKHNRVQVFEDKRYRYDRLGRLGRLSEKRIGSHTVQRFEYDAEQRLIRVQQTKHGDHLRIHYQYDPLGRRIGKQLYRNDDQCPYRRTTFQWQGLRLLQEVQDGRPSLYLYANIDSYEPLARIDGKPGDEEFLYFHTNLAGLPEQLTDEHGLSVWHSEFQAWGNSREEWHNTQHEQEQNLRFQGQYLDRETGLHYNTFRFYDPDIGRFTQPDPIGLLGGINLYQYAPNSTGWIDPLGLISGTTEDGMSRTTPTWRDRYGPASMRDHHLIPQAMMKDEAFIAQMKKAGIADPGDYIHRQISRIPNVQHSNIHKNGWNEQWKIWFAKNPDFKKSDLQRHTKAMMKQYNIPKTSRQFSKKYGCK